MNQAQLLEYFDRISDAPDAIPSLRRFILDLAVRGKLVDQDPNEEPASALLRRFLTDRARLVKLGKIRIPEPAAQIDDNELPFHAPSSWLWVRLTTISRRIHYGYTASANPSLTEVRLLRITDIQNNLVNWSTVPGCEISQREVDQYKLEQGDFLIARTGTIGKTFLVNYLPVTAVFASYLIRVQVAQELHAQYLKLFFESPVYWKQLQDGARGGGQQNVNGQVLGQMLVVIPPVAEQRRIVAKVDELMALCDRLEAAKAEQENRRDRLAAASLHRLSQPADATTFHKHVRFHLDHLPQLTAKPAHIRELRQTILDLAVRGKLVRQDLAEEPASKLLKRIKVDVASRAREGGKKQDATLPPIDTALAPFDLPVGWCWTRFQELGIFGRGKSKHRPRNDPVLFDGGQHLLIQTGDVARSKGVIKTFTSKYNELGLSQSFKWPKGSLCITIAANIADSGILDFDACFPDSVVGFIPASVFSNARYFEYFIRTAKANLLEFAPATAQKNINLEILNALLIPLPPLAEQTRIVGRVDELMGLCDQIEAQLTTAQADSRRLLEAVLYQALNDGPQFVSGSATNGSDVA